MIHIRKYDAETFHQFTYCGYKAKPSEVSYYQVYVNDEDYCDSCILLYFSENAEDASNSIVNNI